MVRHGKTKFQDSWFLDSAVSSWLKKVPGDDSVASCRLCPSSIISVSTMGRQALISHMGSKKHIQKAEAEKKSMGIKTFFKDPLQHCSQPGPSSSGAPLTSIGNRPTSQNLVETLNENSPSIDVTIRIPDKSLMEIDTTLVNPVFNSASTSKKVSVTSFVSKEQVSRSEIIWCLHSVYTHRSNRAAAKDINLLKYMFPENETLQKMHLERTKIGYLVTFGLAPHFKKNLLAELNQCKHFVLSFDESLNKISQSQQMDVIIRFWDSEKNQVVNRYLASAFLKRSTAADLLTAFLGVVHCVDLKKLIQISMDGPNVNKKFLKDLEEYLSVDLKYETQLINIGTCGLHRLHCAFKNAMTATGWDLISFLRAIYNFFKDQPARRGAFTASTGSVTFPKKFCAIRWLENEEVAQTAINILPKLRIFVSSLEKSKPKTKSFQIIEKHLHNPLLGAQLAFFKSISSDVQPLLKEYQSNEPLAPFLYKSLREFISKEMERFVIPEKVLPSLKVLNKNENFLPPKKIDIGIGAKCEIGKCCDNVTSSQVLSFRNDCMNCLKCLVETLLEKSPLQYEATKLISSLDPTIACTKVGQERFEGLVILLTKNNWISSQVGENAMREFKDLCKKKEALEEMKNFSRERLDSFWIHLSEKHCPDNHKSFHMIVKFVLIMSHGNAEVERSFSINKECLIENLKEESLVALRTVYDAVNYYKEVERVPITKDMILDAKNAYSKYSEALKAQKEIESEEIEKKANKRRNMILVRELEEKKRRVMEEAKKQTDVYNKDIERLSRL